MTPEKIFEIGTKFKSRGRHQNECEVVDILTTTNNDGDVVKIRYKVAHSFLGQIVLQHDVTHTAIAMGLIQEIAE